MGGGRHMSWFSRRRVEAGPGPILRVDRLHVHYGRAHALQGVSPHAGARRPRRRRPQRHGQDDAVQRHHRAWCRGVRQHPARRHARLVGLAPHAITRPRRRLRAAGPPRLAVAHGRRASAAGRSAAPNAASWTIERIYETFPRLAERRGNGGSQLSGGEQQMLAIGRALLVNPRLLVMDEPTEGLAPVIVEQVARDAAARSPRRARSSILLIEQNLGVAIDVADTHRRHGQRPHRARACRRARAGGRPRPAAAAARRRPPAMTRRRPAAERRAAPAEAETRIFTVRARHRRRRDAGAVPTPPAPASAPCAASRAGTRPTPRVGPRDQIVSGRGRSRRRAAAVARRPRRQPWPSRTRCRVVELPVATAVGRAAYVAGTFDTKGRELGFLRNCLEKLGLRTVTVDLVDQRARRRRRSVPPREVARHHPERRAAPCSPATAARRSTAMADAFARFIRTRRDLGGIISAGGSGGTALATPAMRALPIGVPKVMVSTVASGDVQPLCRAVRHLHDVFGHRRVRASTASPSRCWPTPRTRSPA